MTDQAMTETQTGTRMGFHTTRIGSNDTRDETIIRLREGLDQVIEENNRQHQRIKELEELLTRVLRAETDG